MNTEIIDYLKTLAKKEFFFVNLADMLFSAVIIICGIISLRTGATMVLYTIMFACAAALLGMNSYKCFRRRSKNGWVFAVLAAAFAALAAFGIYAVVGGY
ncbi:MAG: hypothetical protein K6G58_00520 [Lachnospiraceae bacterium]|nr:hypothetical protein [Lachnospiraceae bacterium]